MAKIVRAEFWGKRGKLPATRDARNFKFGTLVAAAPKLPASYDFDTRYVAVPTPMFANDAHGDCVIAGRAHQTLRFEYVEQHKLLDVTDRDVLREWHRENGNTEQGLNVLESLKEWRSAGWKAAGRVYKIKAFAELDRGRRDEIRRAIFMQVGVGCGFMLPDSAIPQFQSGQIWDVVPGPHGRPNPNDGHYVYCPGYTERGPVGVTWGRKQPMTWRFFERYCDEAFAIIDARDARLRRSVGGLRGRLDYAALDRMLARV